jgi:hypothetical protein
VLINPQTKSFPLPSLQGGCTTMNPKHQTFLLEYYRTGDKAAAYRKAYPAIKDTALNSSVNRLLTRTDIAAAIHEQEQTKRKDIEAEIAERYTAEIIGIYEAQAYLSQIIRGELKREKWVKKKDHWETITVTPSISETLRALNTFFRLKDKVPPLKGAEGDVHPRREKNNNIESPLQAAEAVLPPEPIRTAPHPFGNIYPKTYPGPYYDPGDPNTKEKIQQIQNQSRHSDSESMRKEESPEPMQSAQLQQQLSTTNNNKMEVPPSKGADGDIHSRSTNNNPQQPATSPPFRGGVSNEERRGGATQQEQSQMEVPPSNGAEGNIHPRSTTNNNLQQPATSPPFRGGVSNEERRGGATQHGQDSTSSTLGGVREGSWHQQLYDKRKAWRIKLEQLRKEGWETASELLNEVHDVFINNQHSGTYKMLKQFEKAVQSRNLPVEEREKITQETGWEYHPEHPHVMRRKKRNL